MVYKVEVTKILESRAKIFIKVGFWSLTYKNFVPRFEALSWEILLSNFLPFFWLRILPCCKSNYAIPKTIFVKIIEASEKSLKTISSPISLSKRSMAWDKNFILISPKMISKAFFMNDPGTISDLNLLKKITTWRVKISIIFGTKSA